MVYDKNYGNFYFRHFLNYLAIFFTNKYWKNLQHIYINVQNKSAYIIHIFAKPDISLEVLFNVLCLFMAKISHQIKLLYPYIYFPISAKFEYFYTRAKMYFLEISIKINKTKKRSVKY